MTAIRHNPYVSEVVDHFLMDPSVRNRWPAELVPFLDRGFRAVQDQAFRERVWTWLETQDDEGAGRILREVGDAANSTSATRYRFPSTATPRDQVIKKIFDAAFRQAPDRIIESAEASSGSYLYPLWKRVIWIDAPNLIALVLEAPQVKIFATCALLFSGCIVAYQVYVATAATIQLVAASVMPFVINNTPLQIVRLFNTTMNAISWVFENPVLSFAGFWAARTVILWGPEIPYVSPALRNISLLDVFVTLVGAPQNIFDFLWQVSIDSCVSIYNGMEGISQFFHDMEERAKVEKRAISKPAAYQLWVQMTLPNLRLIQPQGGV